MSQVVKKQTIPDGPPLARIAFILGVTEQEARLFCEEVQEELSSSPPAFGTIADFHAKYYGVRDAKTLAKIIRFEYSQARKRNQEMGQTDSANSSHSRKHGQVPERSTAASVSMQCKICQNYVPKHLLDEHIRMEHSSAPFPPVAANRKWATRNPILLESRHGSRVRNRGLCDECGEKPATRCFTARNGHHSVLLCDDCTIIVVARSFPCSAERQRENRMKWDNEWGAEPHQVSGGLPGSK